ncbi:MAG TPA: hypothetical protein PKW42_09255, partial [bacterium]|nr:hypothetical protein [bacterium]
MERLPVFSGEEIFRRLSESRSLPAGKKRVKLPAGRYFLEWPIILTAADNGLIFEGSGPEKTQLIGASLITGWHRQGKNFLAAYLAEVASGKWFFRHLYVNGSAAARSRLPETGYFEHESVFDVRWMSTSGGGWERKPTAEELGSLVYRKGDPGRWFDPASAEITLVHLWDESLVGVRRHDDSRRRIFFSNPAGHPAGAFGVRKYAIWNIREGLRRPGQWYLNRKSGQLVYWPRQHEKADAIEVLAPLLDTIVSFQGEEKQPVEEIVFQNLSLTATGSPLKAGGFGAREYPGAIELDNVRRCHFSELHIHSVGGQAI